MYEIRFTPSSTSHPEEKRLPRDTSRGEALSFAVHLVITSGVNASVWSVEQECEIYLVEADTRLDDSPESTENYPAIVHLWPQIDPVKVHDLIGRMLGDKEREGEVV